MKNSLPLVIVEFILPMHAFLGCDTVSIVYSIGKGKMLGSKEIQACL